MVPESSRRSLSLSLSGSLFPSLCICTFFPQPRSIIQIKLINVGRQALANNGKPCGNSRQGEKEKERKRGKEQTGRPDPDDQITSAAPANEHCAQRCTSSTLLNPIELRVAWVGLIAQLCDLSDGSGEKLLR